MSGDCASCEAREDQRILERNRFFLSLVLTIPVVVWALTDNPFLTPKYKEAYMLAFTTFIVFYCGLVFFKNAVKSLPKANMNTLVSVGILAAYVYSLYSAFTEGKVLFETAAMLTTFILLGRYSRKKEW